MKNSAEIDQWDQLSPDSELLLGAAFPFPWMKEEISGSPTSYCLQVIPANVKAICVEIKPEWYRRYWKNFVLRIITLKEAPQTGNYVMQKKPTWKHQNNAVHEEKGGKELIRMRINTRPCPHLRLVITSKSWTLGD